MPVVAAFAEPDAFVVHATGVVTYSEVQHTVDAMLAHRSAERARKLLIDGRGVTGAPPTAELRAIAADLKPLKDRGVTCVAIVTEAGFVYGVARMFTVFAEPFGLKVRAFVTMEEAESWLKRFATLPDA